MLTKSVNNMHFIYKSKLAIHTHIKVLIFGEIYSLRTEDYRILPNLAPIMSPVGK